MKVIEPTATVFQFDKDDKLAFDRVQINLKIIVDSMQDNEYVFGFNVDDMLGIYNYITSITNDIDECVDKCNGNIYCES